MTALLTLAEQRVPAGHEVSVYARLIKVGRTSMQVEVEAWARDRHSDDANRVTQAVFAFDAVGQDRRPRPVRPLVPA